ncbi:hypothetical protein [Pseudomonas plecoglossicida]|uniref:hypothetical protein n=1 Tax=Pseudomonas plecoglossicida TaxID=70775 RepID=UPI003D1E3E53
MDYPKSVPSVGLVNGKFVDEDPAAGNPGSLIPSAWGNSITDEVLNVIKGAGDVPDEASFDQLLQAIRKLAGGAVGSARNVRMSVNAASATAILTADEVVVSTALGGRSFRLANLNRTINLTTTGAGGMDTGAAPATGWVAIYAIYNPTTALSALLAVNVTSALAPEVYGGANMPAGYTASALLTVLGTNGSGQFKVASVRDRRVTIPQTQLFTTQSAQPVPGTLINIASIVPRNARRISGNLTVTCSASALLSIAMDADQQLSGRVLISAGVGINQPAGISFSDFPLLTAQTIYITTNSSAGTPTYTGYVTEYEI